MKTTTLEQYLVTIVDLNYIFASSKTAFKTDTSGECGGRSFLAGAEMVSARKRHRRYCWGLL